MTNETTQIESLIGATHVCALHVAYRTQIPLPRVNAALSKLAKSGKIVEHVKGDAKTYSLPNTYTRLKSVIG